MEKILSSLNSMVDASLAIEKLRVASQVRQTHLFLNGIDSLVKDNRISMPTAEELKELWKKKRSIPEIPYSNQLHDPETDELCNRLIGLEDFVDGRVAYLIKAHPAYQWFSRVKGVGKENIGKVVASVGIEKANTISSLWKFAGFSVEDGKAPKRIKGEKLSYNSQLRSMCWRLGSSLLKARGKFYQYYLEEKDKYVMRYDIKGISVVPATSLPKKDGKRYEPADKISEGHVHNQAMRKMIKLFLSCLWLTWREAEGLPITKPYAIDQLGHTSFIDPADMVDRQAR